MVATVGPSCTNPVQNRLLKATFCLSLTPRPPCPAFVACNVKAELGGLRMWLCLSRVGKSRGSSVIPVESLAVVIMFLPTQYMLELVCGFAEIVLRVKLPPVWRLLLTSLNPL